MAHETPEQEKNRLLGRMDSDERDYNLLCPEWPTKPVRFAEGAVIGASPEATYLHRTFNWWLSGKQQNPGSPVASATDAARVGEPNSGKNVELFEAIARFPSAPVYSIHRKREYHYTMPERVNYHTMRVLRRPWPVDAKPGRISRIYLLHNGLNENDNIAFYYDVAARLLDEDKTAACILRPFPGHLSRHPFSKNYAEMPLDRYLLDAGDLFRQFLRFMVETQWLLSMIVPCPSYRVVAGLDLLAERDSQNKGRGDSKELARTIAKSWGDAFDANKPPKSQPARTEQFGKEVTAEAVHGVIDVIRHLVGWEVGHSDSLKPPAQKNTLLPFVHAVGYSLGGFLAQSVFFTWPFAISSCTTICSGGTLRDVALTAFASPEEWQTVMHALRYDMQSAMIEQRIKHKGGRVAGIDLHVFSSLHRIFHAVFLQDFRGSYSSRVSEYIARLFFVVGGNDPIVSIRAVLEASPRGGVNLIEVANLSHFPLTGGVEWQDFWLPEIAGVMSHFAERTEDLLYTTLQENWWNEERTKWFHDGKWIDVLPVDEDPSSVSERIGTRHNTGPSGRRGTLFRRPEVDPETGNEALSSAEFQGELNSMVDVLPEGWLFVSRNDVPSALLGPKRLHRRGTALHHSDAAIRQYVSGLNRRRETMTSPDIQRRITLVVPKPLERWFKRKQPILSGKSEAAASRVPNDTDLADMWKDFSGSWTGSGALREFAPSASPHPSELDIDIRSKNGGIGQAYPILNTLPDVWIALDGRALKLIASALEGDRADYEKAFVKWALRLYRNQEDANRFLQDWLRDEWIRVVKVSGAEFNPRFMGWRIRDLGRARVLVIHTALAYTHSQPA